jgi:hypothetical protein
MTQFEFKKVAWVESKPFQGIPNVSGINWPDKILVVNDQLNVRFHQSTSKIVPKIGLSEILRECLPRVSVGYRRLAWPYGWR